MKLFKYFYIYDINIIEYGDYMKKNTNVLCLLGFILSFLVPPIGLLVCYLGIDDAKKKKEGGRKLGLAGLVISIILTALLAFIIISFFLYAGSETASDNNETLCNEVYSCDDDVDDEGKSTCHYCQNGDCTKTIKCVKTNTPNFNYSIGEDN